jgi:anaphase-promoting complex subunit 11
MHVAAIRKLGPSKARRPLPLPLFNIHLYWGVRRFTKQKFKLLAPTAIMKVTIKSWHAVATWRWDMPEDEVCGICRVQFDGTCPTCKFPGDDCTLCKPDQAIIHSRVLLTSIVIGKCGHSFHMHCLLTWINQDSSKGLCPMCRQKFEWKQDDGPNENSTVPT